MDAGIRPTSLILRKQPHSKWSEKDFLMFEAYQIYRSEHSTEHGEATYITQSGDPSLNVLMFDQTDILGAEIQDFDRKNSEKKKPATGVVRWGELLYVNEQGESVPVPRGGLARMKYMKMMADLSKVQRESIAPAGLDIEVVRPAGGYNPADYGDGV